MFHARKRINNNPVNSATIEWAVYAESLKGTEFEIAWDDGSIDSISFHNGQVILRTELSAPTSLRNPVEEYTSDSQ